MLFEFFTMDFDDGFIWMGYDGRSEADVAAGDTIKLIFSLTEAVLGPSLTAGNPNCRVRVSGPIREFIDDWRQQGRSHHIALGVGIRSGGLEAFGEAMGFGVVRA